MEAPSPGVRCESRTRSAKMFTRRNSPRDAALLETSEPQYDVPSIAATTGRSVTHIYQPLRLTDLIPDAAAVFQANQITIGHAILISRLPHQQQKAALQPTFREDWRTGEQSQARAYLHLARGTAEPHDAHAAPQTRSLHERFQQEMVELAQHWRSTSLATNFVRVHKALRITPALISRLPERYRATIKKPTDAKKRVHRARTHS